MGDERLAGAHRNPQHAPVFISKAATGDDDRIGQLHCLQRCFGGGFDDRDAVASNRIGHWAHRHDHAGLDPGRPVLAMGAHELHFIGRHVRDERRPRRP